MFWCDYPWWNHLGRIAPFQSCLFERSPVPSPDALLRRLVAPVTATDTVLLSSVCLFLSTHFSTHPRLSFTPDTLLGTGDTLFVLLRKNRIVGTLRYHFIGNLSRPDGPIPIHLVDAFCIHPDERKKGIGAYLLAELHRYANKHQMPYALFLKEGPALPILPLPLYSGCYAYARLPVPLHGPSFLDPSKVQVISFTAQQAHRLVSVYRTCQPHTLIITHPTTPNQCWRGYRRGPISILACIQDAHQEMGPGQRMGWVTVWLESPMTSDSDRRMASRLLFQDITEYAWIWIDRRWTGDSVDDPSSPWRADGGFHWYTYQFTSGLSMNAGYGIMI
jgi:GNAT superfamily N-acetyltransferase